MKEQHAWGIVVKSNLVWKGKDDQGYIVESSNRSLVGLTPFPSCYPAKWVPNTSAFGFGVVRRKFRYPRHGEEKTIHRCGPWRRRRKRSLCIVGGSTANEHGDAFGTKVGAGVELARSIRLVWVWNRRANYRSAPPMFGTLGESKSSPSLRARGEIWPWRNYIVWPNYIEPLLDFRSIFPRAAVGSPFRQRTVTCSKGGSSARPFRPPDPCLPLHDDQKKKYRVKKKSLSKHVEWKWQ